MERQLIKEIIKALKRLIKELESGYCDHLTPEQLKELEEGFEKILKIEKEVNNGYRFDCRSNRIFLWYSSFSSLLFHRKRK
jgi:hypothetical protein